MALSRIPPKSPLVAPQPAPLILPLGILSAERCTCWGLTGILDADATLPEMPRGFRFAPGVQDTAVHVCGDTARVTVLSWVQRMFSTTTTIMSLCLERDLTDATWAELMSVHQDNQVDWPLIYEGRRLGLVIRQWADGTDSVDADLGLARRILAHPLWDFLVKLQSIMDANPDEPPETFAYGLNAPLSERAVVDMMFFDRSDDGVRYRLRQMGLPASPRTVQYLRAAAEGRTDTLPSRGLLVTTLVYMTEDDKGGWTFHDGNPTFEITGQHEFARKEHFIKAYEIASKHREWLERFTPHPLTTRQAVAASLSTALIPEEDLTLDFEREAVNAKNLARLQRRLTVRDLNKQSAISAYLDEVYERVRKRRERAGDEGKPPPGWRTRSRAAILRQLEEHP